MKASPTSTTDRNVQYVIYVVSLVIFAFLIWLIYFKPVPQSQIAGVAYLPFVNSVLNSLTSIFLVLGFRAIKKQNKELHKKFMLSAAVTSALFLVTYITYHHFQGDTKFLATGLVRYVYFFILITHVLLSIVQVPLILLTFYHAFRKNWQVHKKLAKITFPIWLYVSVTGVLVFVFLRLFN